MVEVIYAERKSPVLTPSSLACLSTMPTVNITAGCSIGCAYCYTLGYSSHPGEGKIVLYTNLREKLERELSAKRVKPRAVYFSPSSDLFQPIPEALDLCHEILEFLLRKDIGITFLTKGCIPEGIIDLLLRHASNVRAEIGIITLDESISSTFERYAASPQKRLEQIRRLIQGGIETEARIDPILPGVTDSSDNLWHLLSALTQAGVKRVAASILFLRPAITHSIRQAISGSGRFAPLLDHYRNGQPLAIRAERSSIEALAQEQRQEIFARLGSIADGLGLRISVCACKNPDLARGTCGINGRWPRRPVAGVQRRLPEARA